MATLTEGMYPAEFLVSEASGTRSRAVGTLASGNNLDAGTVVGVITASGKYADYDADAADGTETAAGVLLAPVDASSADADCVVIVRDAEVNADELTWTDQANDETAGTADLAALGIIVR